MLAALTRVFGVHNLALAEDVVQETLTNAFEVWSHCGEVPKHAGALLMTSAKNRAIDAFRRERTARKFAPEIGRLAESEWTLRPVVEELFLPDALKDDELRMMFSCCEPRVGRLGAGPQVSAEDVQVSLILNVLCGFTVHELASAFLITEAAMAKRLSRGKKALAESKRLFELTAEDFAPRLSSVHRALYLLFNEGYHGASTAHAVRKDLCHEAMRLVRLLCDHAPAATPETQALAALMFLNAARLDTRIDEATGNLTSLAEQDRSRWDTKLIAEGLRLLDASAKGDALTEIHVEAGIAALHASAPSLKETNWKEVVVLYGMLLKINPSSPVVALNRAVAIGEAEGPDAGLAALDAITDVDRLLPYPFYEATRGELELRRGNRDRARTHFEEARKRARNDSERHFLDQRIARAAPD
jgi:predicted RNA polymerase sigma factor